MIGQKGLPATYGGIERHVEELARRFVARGHRVTAYCRPHYTPPGAVLDGVELVRLPSVNTKHLDAITHTAVATGHVLLSGADIVHYHALGPSALAWCPRLAGRRVVVTVHGLDWRREKWGTIASAMLRFGEWTARTFPHATVVVSRTLEEHFARHGTPHLHYIPNGTALPPPGPSGPLAELGLEAGKFLLFVGRLVPEKGLHVLLQAHRDAAPEWPLVIAGAGHFTDDYVSACRRAAGPGARFLGPVYGATLAALQQNAALVIVPSSLEGLSIALLEAMSYGTPVLGSDIPENREVLSGVGETFRTGDAADLGCRLRALLEDEEHRVTMGRRGRERIATEYDWERVVDRTLSLYGSLLARPGVAA
jgi:glycosyltransferase involved in cell wall biosynthesis